MKLKAMREALTRAVTKKAMLVKKYSPEILTVVAVGSTLAAVGTAIHATLKLDDITSYIEAHQEKKAQVKEYKDAGEISEEEYSEADEKRDDMIFLVKTGVKLMKHYAVPAAFTAVSTASILELYNVLSKRYAAAVAAYMAVQSTFEAYRHEVKERIGENEERGVFEKTSLKMDRLQYDAEESRSRNRRNIGSQYARWFDEASRYWKKAPGENLIFIRRQQQYANDLLRIHGHLFLNEVYDLLDIPRTSAGSIVGWIYEPGDTESLVDFGLSEHWQPSVRDFLNGRERNILLDFNVDGIIYDLI